MPHVHGQPKKLTPYSANSPRNCLPIKFPPPPAKNASAVEYAKTVEVTNVNFSSGFLRVEITPTPVAL